MCVLVPGAEIRILDRKRVGHTVHVNVYLLDKPLFLEAEEIARKKCDMEYNRGRVLPLNRLTLGLAERYAKGIVCCSDTHTQAPGRSSSSWWPATSRGTPARS